MPKSRKLKKRGGYNNEMQGTCSYNVNDDTTRVNSENAQELQKVYFSCCPKTRFGFKNKAPFCKNLSKQYTMLQQARNYETKEFFEKDNDRYLNNDDEDYFKPRNMIMNEDEDEFRKEWKGPVESLGGKSRKRHMKKRHLKKRKTSKRRKI